MLLADKIRQVRKEKSLSIRGLESRLKGLFGERALRYNTLYRIEKGLRDPRLSSLTQICLGLNVTLKEIAEGTEEEKLGLITHIKKRDKAAQYTYSDKALAQILTTEKQPFLAMRLILQPGAATNTEQDPLEIGKFQKWIYCVKGKVNCVVGKDTYLLRKDEVLCFESNLPHHFENNAAKKSVCIVVQNPRHI